jgi:cytoskeletal protein CcmA (bactofilin family)
MIKLRRASGETAATSAESGLSVVAEGVRVIGNIECAGVLKVEGTVEGSIMGPRQFLLGRNGIIHGDVHANEVVIGGSVEGNIVADSRVEIQSTSSVEGDVLARSIVILEGGRINGTVRMLSPASPSNVEDVAAD